MIGALREMKTKNCELGNRKLPSLRGSYGQFMKETTAQLADREAGQQEKGGPPDRGKRHWNTGCVCVCVCVCVFRKLLSFSRNGQLWLEHCTGTGQSLEVAIERKTKSYLVILFFSPKQQD